MKNLLIIGMLSLVASVANAATLSCTTNIHHDPRIVSTDFTLNSVGRNQAQVTVQTRGGMAQFMTQPRNILVQAQAYGPEVVQYFNAKEDFNLEIVFQPMNGEIHGTYIGDILGRRVQAPVVCVMASN